MGAIGAAHQQISRQSGNDQNKDDVFFFNFHFLFSMSEGSKVQGSEVQGSKVEDLKVRISGIKRIIFSLICSIV
jgi:hypothetical protein